LDDGRRAALDSAERVRLIIGAPGVGKTFFGCQLAECEVGTGRIVKKPYQKVLFLTFSRNAVARIRQIVQTDSTNGSKRKEPTFGLNGGQEDHIRIETFAGFFWWLTESYGRYSDGGSHLRPWLLGPRRVGGEYVPDGHIGYTFDEIHSTALSILQIKAVQELVADLYPLIIIDEHQDIDDQLHEVIILLSRGSHIVLLRGPGQCIYGSMKQFDPEKILVRTSKELHPETFPISALGGERQRCCPEISDYIAQYDSEETCRYDGKRTRLKLVNPRTRNGHPNDLEVHAALMIRDIRSYVRSLTSESRLSFAVLASTNSGVADLHKKLVTGSDSYKLSRTRADLSTDDLKILGYGRLVFSLLSSHWVAHRRPEVDVGIVASEIASLAADAYKTTAAATPSVYLPFAKILMEIVTKQKKPKKGDDPADKLLIDLAKVNVLLRAAKKDFSKHGIPKTVPSTPFTKEDSSLLAYLADHLVRLVRLPLHNSGTIDVLNARRAFESSMQQRIIFEKLGISTNLEVMTIHKSKGREFDGVVLVLENNRKALWRAESRTVDSEVKDLYRVAISRARHVLGIVAFNDAAGSAKPVVQRLLPPIG
jgi:DNA helicase-2/ATP-dependent DNA helicase PcrA